MKRRFVRAALAVALVAASVPVVIASLPAQAAVNGTFRNPLGPTADPFIVHHDGNYYLVDNNANAANGFAIAKSPSLANLWTAPRTTVWTGDDPSRNRNMWAPSLRFFDGRWYLYYTADDGVDENHRNYVLESEGADPLGPYHFKNKLSAVGDDSFGIDGDVLVQNNGMYLIWSGAGVEGHNELRVAPMSNPYTVSGSRVHLPAAGSCPEVREAPSFLRSGDRNYLVYSTCDTGKPDYSLWMKSIHVDADPMNPDNWADHGAVFTRHDEVGVYGPGSNNFFTSPDGTETWIAYHAKNTTTYTYAGRNTRAQRITFNGDGSPNLGRPLAVGATQDLPSGDPGGGPYWINDDGRSERDGAVSYSGNWNSGNGCAAQCFWGDDHWTDEVGATATFTFTGTQLALLSVRDTGNGIAAVSVDGGPETRHDFYSPIRQGEQVNYVSPRLPYGTHTVRVRVTGDRNPASGAAYISIDRAEAYTN